MPDIDKTRISAAFDRAAPSYDALANFQHRVGERLDQLASSLPDVKPGRILDAGCGTGYGTSLLSQRWPHAQVLGCDLAPAMVSMTQARGFKCLCADLEQLPMADGSFDLVWSSLALQWCQSKLAYTELQRVLRPGGWLVFSTLGPGTLRELEAAFEGLDGYRHVLPFPTFSELECELHGAGFEPISVQCENWITRHSDFKSLLGTIGGIGANQIGGNRRRGLMGKTAWGTAKARYEALRGADGLLPASYEVILGCAQKRH